MRIPTAGRPTLAATVVLLVLAALVAAGRPAPAANAQEPPVADPRAAVVLQFFAAGNDGDVDGQMAVVASDATWISAPRCPAQNPCQGADAARQQFEAVAAAHTSFTVTSIQVLGSAVVAQVQVQNDATRSAGVDWVAVTIVAQVPQDQITVWLTLPDLAVQRG